MNQTRTLVILLVALLVISTAGMGMGAGMMGPGMMGGYWAGGGGAWWPAMLLGWVGMLGFWVVVVLLGILLVRWLVGPGQLGRQPEDDALSILRRRYAAGEIDQETFERMKRELAS